jgi:hypothetical protein
LGIIYLVQDEEFILDGRVRVEADCQQESVLRDTTREGGRRRF